MSPLNGLQQESIMRRLEFIRAEMADLAQFQGMGQEDYHTDRNRRRNLERLAENTVNAALDVAKVVLAGESLPVPETYREVMLQLGQIGFLGNDLAAKMAEFARLRNVLAHQYLEIRWEMLSRFISEGEAMLKRFVEAAEGKVVRLIDGAVDDSFHS